METKTSVAHVSRLWSDDDKVRFPECPLTGKALRRGRRADECRALA